MRKIGNVYVDLIAPNCHLQYSCRKCRCKSDYVAEIRHSLNMGSDDVLFMSTDRVDLKTRTLKHIRISDKKTTARPPLGAKSKIELTDYRNIRQYRICSISASNKHVDDLVPDKSYFLVLAAKLIDGCVLVQRLCGVTSLLQHNSDKDPVYALKSSPGPCSQ